MPHQSNGYFSISFADLIGFFITIISVFLILKQLSDSRLAVQVESYLTISDRFSKITPSIQFVDGLSLSEEWKRLDGKAAYLYLTENEVRYEHYMQVGAFYEVVSALLRRGALDDKLAINTFGGFGKNRWHAVEKAVRYHRELIGEPELYDQWEWLADNILTL